MRNKDKKPTKSRKNTAIIPPGWDYNPSSWPNRYPIIVLALIDVWIAGYLALYQYGIVPEIWEPFFGNGSEIILDSWLSHILPVSDATLGALAYLADALTGSIGGEGRWKTQPWIVIIFGILVGPLGLISVGLVIAQPILFDAWCTLCLISAVLSIAMIGPAMDETLASLQYLKQSRKHGTKKFWQNFWGKTDVGTCH